MEGGGGAEDGEEKLREETKYFRGEYFQGEYFQGEYFGESVEFDIDEEVGDNAKYASLGRLLRSSSESMLTC